MIEGAHGVVEVFERRLALIFSLRHGVKWHDGQPFSAADVKCTFDLLTDQGKEKLRLNYRGSWWVNVSGVTTNGALEATIHLKRPQPAILAMLASGYRRSRQLAFGARMP